jgi:palmitoyl-protein thioesterase
MQNLISLGAPQQGVNQYPRCEQNLGTLCKTFQSVINTFGYFWLFQKLLAPATYWHDTNEEAYRKGSTFLAVINNENHYNADYVLNLHRLRRIVLVKYENDQAIIPSESAWFGYYDKDRVNFPMEETEVYKRDKLGLKTLVDSGRLIRIVSPGDHLDLYEVWFMQKVMPYLKEVV